MVLKTINHGYRIVVTGLSFLFFAIGGLCIGLLVYPLLKAVIPAHKQTQCGQAVIHKAFKLFSGFMQWVGIFNLSIENKSQLLKPNQFFIANHPTLIDVVILLSVIKRSDCVVKAALAKNPFTKGPLLTAGYIVNNKPEHLVEDCAKSLKSGHNLLIFPEGTRTKELSSPLKFKRGAALIALAAKHPVTPITIECRPRMLAKGQKWYKIPPIKPHYVIKVGAPMVFESEFQSNEPVSTLARKVNHMILKHYQKELSIGKINQ